VCILSHAHCKLVVWHCALFSDSWICCLHCCSRSYEANSEWEVVGTSVQRKEFHFECCPTELFSNIVFSVEIRRRHEFYVMNIVLPGVLTSAVLLSIFYCIPSQKVHIGVAAILSLRLFLVNVADNVPRTSDHIPMLGPYITVHIRNLDLYNWLSSRGVFMILLFWGVEIFPFDAVSW